MLGKPRAALRGPTDTIEHALELLGIVEIAEREFARAHDRGQQIVEVMRQAAGQLTECLHLLRPE